MKRLMPLLLLLAVLSAGCGDANKASDGVAAVVAADGQSQQIDIFVDHAYKPDDIVLKPGLPARLNFFRREKSESCAKALVIPLANVDVELPNHKIYTVELPPQKAGTEIPFHCSMNMMKGKMTVSD